MKRADYERALKLYKPKKDPYGNWITLPCAVEVKRRGASQWTKYRFKDVSRIDWDTVDAARLHYADKAWVDGKASESSTTGVRIFSK